ncbi:MAG TPA: acyclic terpene utilization AtuA family protein [Bdellovibrionales bacterium]|nr:acyclic terpene utilization AtuA family protein [Bdellovibrionales bacterium]
MSDNRSVTIACASAFWGDTPLAVQQLLREDDLDFIVFDYLSEVTLALLARAKKKDPSTGFIGDFLTDVVEPHLAEIQRRKIRLVSNAGGLNPVAMKARIEEWAASKNIPIRVACVTGDDVQQNSELLPPGLSGRTLSANAYLGAPAIVEALNEGADLVILGRTVDTALAVGPLVHAFGWSWKDFDKLSQASLAGHIIECGTQATGGNFTDWESVPKKEDVGFPIIRCFEDGSFFVTKPNDTGGIVSKASVAEQITYETGDPSAYLLPDVTCDWSEVKLEELEPNRVMVIGARGRAPVDRYKAIATHQEGFKVSTTAFIAGGDARAKARSIGQAILARCANAIIARGQPRYSEVNLEVLGGDDEALLRISAAHPDPSVLEILAKEIAPAATSLAPGMTNLLGGRASVVPRVAMTSFFIPKRALPVRVVMGGAVKDVDVPGESSAPVEKVRREPPTLLKLRGKRKLSEVAYARSGDKGNHVNIGVIARNPEDFILLQSYLTEERLIRYFEKYFDGEPEVEIWDWPGLNAVNILLKNCLGGGGAYSLRIDPQGKSYAQRLLEMEISEGKR